MQFSLFLQFFSVIGVENLPYTLNNQMQAKITLQAVWAFFTSSCRWLFATFLFLLNGLVIFFGFGLKKFCVLRLRWLVHARERSPIDKKNNITAQAAKCFFVTLPT